ncbi:MAG TPA: ThuA domain-containing protein, partial [Nitriliruptoraceae bacterium]|nr:ThuA domain-containing protein [Nitriliruptoraceae bacterium]
VDDNTSDIGSADFTIAEEDTPRILVFSKTAGFRHSSIPAGQQAITELANENGAVTVITENGNAFSDSYLAQFDAVVFLSTTGDVLNGVQQDAFERYIQGGGGFAGVHAASDTEYDWEWYGDLVGAYFEGHPPGTPEATLHVEDGDHPSTDHLPEDWTRVDEWYSFQENPREDVHVLMTIDESTYAVGDDLAMGDHPMSWCHDYDGGRSWYTALGHTEASFTTDELFREHMWGGIATAAGLEEADCATMDELTLDVSVDPAEADGRDGWYVSPVTVTAATNDDATVEFNLDGAGWVADDDGVLVIDTDGSHTLEVRAVRGDETTEVETVEVNLDTTAPELSVDGIADGDEFIAGLGNEVTWSATDATSGLRIIRVRLDGDIIDRDLPDGGPFLPGSVAPGEHELFVRAHDNAGNFVTVRYDFTVVEDTTGPEVTVSGIDDEATYGVSESLDVTVTAVDDLSGLDSLTVSVDGDEIASGDSPQEFELDLWDLPLGDHTLRVEAVDAIGNTTVVEVDFTTESSYGDLDALIDMLEDDGAISASEADALRRDLAKSESMADKGKAKQARQWIDRAIDTAEGLDDDTASDVLVAALEDLYDQQ